MLAWALFQDLGIKIVVLFIGIYLILKGFSIEEAILNWFKSLKETISTERVTFPLYVGSLLTLILSGVSGYENALLNTKNWLMMGANFTEGFLPLFILSIILFILGRMGDFYYRKEVLKIKRYAITMVAVFSLWLVLSKAVALIIGKVLLDEFIAFVILAFFGTIVGLAAVRMIYTSIYITARIQKNMDVYDRYGIKMGTINNINKKGGFIQVDSKKEKRDFRFSKVLLVDQGQNFAIVSS